LCIPGDKEFLNRGGLMTRRLYGRVSFGRDRGTAVTFLLRGFLPIEARDIAQGYVSQFDDERIRAEFGLMMMSRSYWSVSFAER
jgi:hypothetical protein